MILNAGWLSSYYKRNYNNTKKGITMKNDEAYFDAPVRVSSISTEGFISDGLPVGDKSSINFGEMTGP